MLRINEFQFYELAIAIHPITLINTSTKYSDVVFDWMTAKTALQNIFKQRALEFCYETANGLFLALREIVPDDFDAAIAKIPDPNAQETTLGYSIHKVKEAAEKFETVLSAELLDFAKGNSQNVGFNDGCQTGTAIERSERNSRRSTKRIR